MTTQTGNTDADEDVSLTDAHRATATAPRRPRELCPRENSAACVTRHGQYREMNSTDTAERRLTQLLCGTVAARDAAVDEISVLLARVDCERLLRLLRRTGLVVQLGERLLALGRKFPELEEELQSVRGSARTWGTATELASLGVLDRLALAGIRALPLKGSILARELHGDVAARRSVDIDILIAPETLSDAVTALSEAGWRWLSDVRRIDGLPVLHETLVHASFPRLELHWRVHWYERQFAVDVLARAESSAPGEPLRMQPLDGLVTLMLFYARDGFAGLRFPSDAAAWWDLRCAEVDVGSPVTFVRQRYPALLAPVSVASKLLVELVGLPVDAGHEKEWRWRVATGLANPFLEGDREQMRANAGLTDLLLAPRRDAAGAIQRVLRNAPPRPTYAAAAAPAPWRPSAGHVIRVAGRWTLALVSVLLRRISSERDIAT
jgi:hypothetical protein